jgi:hypothetical protein
MSNYGPYHGIADKVGLSVITVRSAFKREPITYKTAKRLANALEIPVHVFRIKVDRRGCPKNTKVMVKQLNKLRLELHAKN